MYIALYDADDDSYDDSDNDAEDDDNHNYYAEDNNVVAEYAVRRCSDKSTI